MKLIVRIFLIFLFPFLLFGQDIQYSKARIYYDNQQEYNRLKSYGVVLDHVKHKKNVFVEGDFSSDDLSVSTMLGYKIDVLINDVQEYYINRNISSDNIEKQISNSCSNNSVDYLNLLNYNHGSMGGYLTYEQVMREIDSMSLLYPNLITPRSTVGSFTTYEGRSLHWVKISDNPLIDENEPEILYDAIHHAREPMSVQQLIFYMWYLLENYSTNSEIKYIVDNTELYFVPFVNPDGYIYNQTNYPNGGGMWRKNRRSHANGDYGVDNNRNYDYIDPVNGNVWGTNGISFNTNSDIYCGDHAFSEPENQAMKWFLEEHEFRIVLNNHSYSHLLLYPFGHDQGIYTPDHNTYFAISDIMTNANNMDSQLAWELYPASGNSDDFMYGDTSGHSKVFSFTPEIGTGDQGFWPISSDIDPLCKSMMDLNLKAAHIVGDYSKVTDKNSFFIENINGFLFYDITSYGLDNTNNFTVSIIPISNNIQSIGNSNIHSNLSLLQGNLDSISYSLNSNIAIGSLIEYVIEVNNGLYAFRDTINKIYGVPQQIFYDDCSNTSSWTNQSPWSTTSSSYYSFPSSITDSPNGDYNDNIDKKIVISNSIDLTDAISAYVSFWSKWELEDNWDYVQFEISVDNGATWIPQCGINTENGTSDQDENQPVYDGLQNTWVKEIIDITDYVNQNIYARFQIVTDGWNSYDGFYFDDFQVNALFPPILGCTDSLACNYDFTANLDDGSCRYNTIYYDTVITNNNYIWNGLILSMSGDYSDTLIDVYGCDSILNLNLTIIPLSIYDLASDKQVLKILNVFGQDVTYVKNSLLIYIYDDGRVEKRIMIE